MLTFAGPSALDRAAHLRDGELPAGQAVVVGPGQTVRLDGGRALVREPAADGGLVFLGLEPPGQALFAAEGEGDGFAALREAAASMPPAEAAIAAYAVAMVGWHRLQRYCGRCGTATRPVQAGHRRDCPNCGAHWFPRTDPAVTMLVHDGERCLLSRRRTAAPGRWSALAGFVEPGETPEAAVVREAREEVGVEVREVQYLCAQPWPFPQALMLGFRAITAPGGGEAAVHDLAELVEARWFTRAELRAALAANKLSLPPATAIGHHLITGWLDAPAP